MSFKLDNRYIELLFYFFPLIVMILAIINILHFIKKKEIDKKYKRNRIIIIVLYLIILIPTSYKDEIEKYIRLNYPNLYGKYIITVIDNKEYVVLQIIKDNYIIADVKRESKNLTIYRDTIREYTFPGIMEFYYDNFDNVKVEDKEEK